VGPTTIPTVDPGDQLPRDNGDGAGARPLRRRAGLPGGRAVVGGLLVALAALGVFTAWQQAAGGPGTSYAVATRALRPGQVLAPGDVELRPAELPSPSASRAYTDAAALVGAVVLGPLAEGDLVQRSSVVERGGTSGLPRHEMSFALPSDRAVDGTLRPGERVAVLATYGTGAEAETETVAEGALVVAVTEQGGGIDGGGVVLTLAVDTREDVVAVTHAARAGEVTVVQAPAGG
jgi:Flp pilus assembly protein CpaB